MRTREWTYLTATHPGEAELSRLGRLGWELCGIDDGNFVFKRPAVSFRDRVTLDQKRRYFGAWGLSIDESEAAR